MKKGRLSKLEKFYIENNLDESPSDIAKELDRSVGIVKRHIERTAGKSKKKSDEEQPKKKDDKSPLDKSPMGRSFAYSNEKRYKGIVSATASSASRGDRAKKGPKKPLSHFQKNIAPAIREDE